MRIDIITVLPEMLEGFVHESILARAEKKGLAEIRLHNLRDYTLDKWRRVDDYPYGGSAGMVMQCEPIDRCITALKAERDYDEVIFTSPDGERFDQHTSISPTNSRSRATSSSWQATIKVSTSVFATTSSLARSPLVTSCSLVASWWQP